MPLSNAEKQARYRARRRGIVPEERDIRLVDQQYGRLPENASDKRHAERYRLYQAQALIRLWKAGKLPLDQLRGFDELARRMAG